jgi:sugar lactone lactonase YvrE
MKLLEIPGVVMLLAGLCSCAGLDTPAARADFTLGERVNLGPTVNSPQGEGMPIISRDGLELYFCSDRPGGYGDWDVWVSKRASLEDSWGAPENLGSGVNTAFDERPTSISSDGLTLYLHVYAGGSWNLYTTTRPAKDAVWGSRVNLGPVLNPSGSTRGSDIMGVVSADDLTLLFGSNRPGATGGSVDIYKTTRATPSDPWGPPVNLGSPLNSPQWEVPGPMSPDGLVLFLAAENRPGGFGGMEMWMTRRSNTGAAWSEPVHLGLPPDAGPTSLSPDGQWAYITEHPPSGIPRVADLWIAPIIPTLDFNGDGAVDIDDLLILIESWGQADSRCDIGPYAWGDGKVDAGDVEVFMAYYGQEKRPVQDTFPDFIATDGSAEGVAVDEAGNVYVSVRAASDQVWKFSPSGEQSILADLGTPGGNAVGLAVDAAGNVYACQALTGAGVYWIAPNGRYARLPGTEQIVFPNALVFAEQETLYITETVSGDVAGGAFGQGGIWRLQTGGTAELWLRDDLLTGVAPSLFPYPVGANGIVLHCGDLYVANTDKASIVHVPVQPDGTPGQPEIWKQVEDVPESLLYQSPVFPLMVDGLALDDQGNIYVAVPSRNAVVRITAHDRAQETVAVYPQVPLDAPVSLAFGTAKSGARTLFITNLGVCASLIPDLPWAGPGLVTISTQGPKASN